MPAVTSGRVLVTGASGFIAAQLCADLLKRGYTVVGTVRSDSKGEYLTKLYNNPKWSYVLVPDNEAVGAFDEAVKGNFDAVEHTSSPFHMNAPHPDGLIGPAVKGTLSVLEAVQKYAPTVKRIVVTSSVAAINGGDKEPGHTFTEAEWNEVSPEIVKQKGKDTPQPHPYLASKALAERAAWDFVASEKKKGTLNWDLVTINPPMVYGPTTHEVKDLSAINTSIGQFYMSLTDSSLHDNPKATAQRRLNFVDVRDVSEAHILALEVEEAGGERFIVSHGPYSYQDFYDDLNEAKIPNVPKGHPGSERGIASVESGAKAEKVLGLKYHSRKDTVVDTVNSLRERFPEARASL